MLDLDINGPVVCLPSSAWPAVQFHMSFIFMAPQLEDIASLRIVVMTKKRLTQAVKGLAVVNCNEHRAMSAILELCLEVEDCRFKETWTSSSHIRECILQTVEVVSALGGQKGFIHAKLATTTVPESRYQEEGFGVWYSMRLWC